MLAVAALSLTGCTNNDEVASQGDVNTVSEELATSIDEAIEAALTYSGSTEAVVGVWKGDDAYVRGYGDGVSGSTKFRAAQASQPVMCALLLTLADEEGFSLDREINKDITRLSGIEDITYEQLCTHTSGVRDFKRGLGDIFVNNPTRGWPEQELIANGLASGKLAWPGLDVHLSDTNPLLLDRALRLHTGESTSDLLSEKVFEPTGMGHTSYPRSFSATTPPNDSLQPLAYGSSGGKAVCETGALEIEELSPSSMRGAGSTITTVTDLKEFYDAYLSGTFGGESLGDRATEGLLKQNPKRDENGEPTEEVDPEGEQIIFGGMEKIGSFYGRSGSIPGTMTAAYTDPESGITVVVALNNSSAGAGFAKQLAFQLAALTGGESTPWNAEEQASKLAEAAICQVDPEAEGEG